MFLRDMIAIKNVMGIISIMIVMHKPGFDAKVDIFQQRLFTFVSALTLASDFFSSMVCILPTNEITYPDGQLDTETISYVCSDRIISFETLFNE
jgi:hypothetical protein